jgi:hypothetical protein
MAARAAWRATAALWAADALVFVEESGSQTKMTPRTSRAPHGQRAVGRRRAITALSAEGMGAAMTREGAADAVAFVAGRPLGSMPAYSPDFTPIEQAFSKLKTFLRRTEARTREALDEAITAALATVTATDAADWFTACGYPLKTGQ